MKNPKEDTQRQPNKQEHKEILLHYSKTTVYTLGFDIDFQSVVFQKCVSQTAVKLETPV